MREKPVTEDSLDIMLMVQAAIDMGHPVHVTGRTDPGGMPIIILAAAGEDVRRVLACLSQRWPYKQDLGPAPGRPTAQED